MDEAQLLYVYRWQLFGCAVIVLLILLVIASATEQVIRHGISHRRKHRLNHPLKLHPSPLDGRITAA